MTKLLVLLLVSCLILVKTLDTTLLQQDTDKNKWTSVALTADGKKIFASVSGNGILTGSDFGYSSEKLTGYDWYQTNALYRDWQTIAMSKNGGLLCAVMNVGVIHISTNEFSSWNVSSVPVAAWSGVAVSETGMHLIATQNQAAGAVFVSHNFGVKWEPSRIKVAGPWCSVACSLSGMNVAIASCEGGVHISNNYGDDFAIAFAGRSRISAIAMDGSGKEIVVTVNGGKIHVSHDFGVSWSTTKSPSANWKAIASSESGQFVYAVVYEGGLYYSEDYGEKWAKSDSPNGKWTSIATSSDGSVIVASDYEGYIYANHDDKYTIIPSWLRVVIAVLISIGLGIGLVLLCVTTYRAVYGVTNPYSNLNYLLPTRG